MKLIPFAKPSIGFREKRAVQRALRSGWLTSGPICRQFEQEFASVSKTRHAIAVSSATAGLHVALAAAGFGSGDTLCLSPYTFAASAAVGLHLGMQLRFVDIEEHGYNIDCDLLEEAVQQIRSASPQSKGRIAIMAVHIAGQVCDMQRICAIANRYQCFVIEDAAHCQPLIGEGEAVGSRGDCVVFSFYATKPMTTAEGGMVITDNDHIAQQIRLLRNHGMSASLWERADSKIASWSYDIKAHGYKYNLPDPLAAIGRVQLNRTHKHWQARLAIAKYYHRHLLHSAWIEPPALPMECATETHAWHLFLCQLRHSALTIRRDRFITLLRDSGVQCSLHYLPLHLTSVYQQDFGYSETDFARATKRYHGVISLPLYPRLSKAMCARVLRAIDAIGQRYAAH